jgi:ppGpp synthetase/RelA/SpoT-type nucleotidyltranferase
MTKESTFLVDYNIKPEHWKAANIKREVLLDIERDFLSRSADFRNSAAYLANVMQAISRVHSVRWRVKDSKHLVEKIVRKRAANIEKYEVITVGNYHEIVTDLIGIRAIHLFKADLGEIDSLIRKQWEICETPTVYIRDGDNEVIPVSEEHRIKKHEFGYRSAHYVIQSTPSKQKILAELQVRTIFEEGWSEIDHTLRYPNHTDDPDLKSVLTIFNRMAGSADEIASFALRLKSSLEEVNGQLDTLRTEAEQAKKERDASIEKMEVLLSELQEHKVRGDQYQQLVTKLQTEVASLKNQGSNNNQIAVPLSTTISSNNQPQNAGVLLAALVAAALFSK